MILIKLWKDEFDRIDTLNVAIIEFVIPSTCNICQNYHSGNFRRIKINVNSIELVKTILNIVIMNLNDEKLFLRR